MREVPSPFDVASCSSLEVSSDFVLDSDFVALCPGFFPPLLVLGLFSGEAELWCSDGFEEKDCSNGLGSRWWREGFVVLFCD